MDDEFSAIESAEQQEPKVVLVVSHGGFIRMFLQHVCGFKNVDIINNTSFSTIDVFVKCFGGCVAHVMVVATTGSDPEDSQIGNMQLCILVHCNRIFLLMQ